MSTRWSVALVLFAAGVCVSASSGLLFGGVFSIGDPYCDYCTSPNLLSNSGFECGCPPGYTAFPSMPSHTGQPYGLLMPSNNAPLLRVMTPCSAPMWHGSLSFCVAPTGTNTTSSASPVFAQPAPSSAPSEFAGVYQREDGNGAKSGRSDPCRIANPLTGDCSCPSDSSPIELRVLTSAQESIVHFSERHNLESAPGYGSSLVMCVRKQAQDYQHKNFAGAYQTEDSSAVGGGECRVVNPVTGDCSCPAESSVQQFRVIAASGVASTVFVCGARVLRSSTVELCSGVSVDNTGNVPIGAALAQCLYYFPDFLRPLEIPVGIFLMDQQVNLRGQLRTQGTLDQSTCLSTPALCATLKAAPSLNVPMFSSNGFLLTHIILDGNKAARQQWVGSCTNQGLPKSGSNGYSICSGCVFMFNAFTNALCGSGWFLTGEGVIVAYNLFKNNGDRSDVTKAWADGLTMTAADGSLIASNTFLDNSGSGLAIGGGAGSLHTSNRVIQQGADGFSGLTFDTLHGFHFSEFRNTTIQNNTITGYGRLDFGLQLGGRPWYNGASAIIGGEPITAVTRNTISGAAVNINCDAAAFVSVWGNLLNDTVPLPAKLSHCATPVSLFNISPDSRIDRRGESVPLASRNTYTGCVPGL